ncbi:PLP-dependent transferase [Oscillibacter sp.]|uniref:PLP-dependent transferase n=1 Tax=Oscillibacter sp. TaxID=1945593 RepID=UPI0026157194|nr:PLP-dependent transferase [Oscillibacter sp.]MDD3347494.1 PLP-dependent transferase [Oscillibacter sp.]
METPILDFVERYAASDVARLHMPGHKGKPFLGCEKLDITEIFGADALYEASGIIARSEENAAALFGAGRTFYSTEGSSQCIRAMLYLALTNRPKEAHRVIVAARNVHKAFVYAAALLDFEIVWLWPEGSSSLCACPVSPKALEQTLESLDAPPAAVYLTSPDYLGGMADIAALSAVCHRHGTVLAVDNAHGAYLHFLRPAVHPLDLGADLCCDSAHKTLSVLTGGAYLHVAKSAPQGFSENGKAALALFGSTSPSYLTLCSLDRCNRTLSEAYPPRLLETVAQLDALRHSLGKARWQVEPSDPLRLTLRSPGSGVALARQLRRHGVECEYADRDFLVLMATPENAAADFTRVEQALGENLAPCTPAPALPTAKGRQVLSVRQALFAPCETIAAQEALGRICGAPTVSCPPAIPIAVSGEEIGPEALELLRYYGVETVNVVKSV